MLQKGLTFQPRAMVEPSLVFTIDFGFVFSASLVARYVMVTPSRPS
jgi:hypothetical protein